MRAFGALFVGGITGIVILKLLATLLFPLLGFMVGLVGMAFKIVLFGTIAYFVYTLLKGRRDRSAEV
jgi:hypothetical protein